LWAIFPQADVEIRKQWNSATRCIMQFSHFYYCIQPVIQVGNTKQSQRKGSSKAGSITA